MSNASLRVQVFISISDDNTIKSLQSFAMDYLNSMQYSESLVLPILQLGYKCCAYLHFFLSNRAHCTALCSSYRFEFYSHTQLKWLMISPHNIYYPRKSTAMSQGLADFSLESPYPWGIHQTVDIYPYYTSLQNIGEVVDPNQSPSYHYEAYPSKYILGRDSSTTPLSETPEVGWNRSDVWNYHFQVGQGASKVTSTSDIYESGDVNFPSYAPQDVPQCPALDAISDTRIQSCAKQQSHSIHTIPAIGKTSFPTTECHNPAYGQTCLSQSNLIIPSSYSLTRAPISMPSNPSPRSKSKSRAKIHNCFSCTRRFSRKADLERHFETIHLLIRHHCYKKGCSNNHGRGYCRLEKLKGHISSAHGAL